MQTVRWGMIGCGDVAEVKSGPGSRRPTVGARRRHAPRSREGRRLARRHGVPRVHGDAEELINDPEVDAVYIATPPSSHCELALKVAAAGKPCLVEKPMAMNHAECLQMVDAFRAAERPLWVAYYRRALPRFLKVRELLRARRDRAADVDSRQGHRPACHRRCREGVALQSRDRGRGTVSRSRVALLRHHRFSRGAGYRGRRLRAEHRRRYAAEDVTAAAFQIGDKVAGTGMWNFNAPESADSIVFTGSEGEIATAVRADEDVVVTRGGQPNLYRFRNPPHVHQPLIQTIVDELRGKGKCESTGESACALGMGYRHVLASYYRGSEKRTTKNE